MAEGPNFDRPPVVEVVLGVQHDPLPSFDFPLLAHYWELIRGEFPGWTQRPPLNFVVETFEAPSPRRPAGVTLNVEEAPGPARSMFEGTTGENLIQIQADRFLHNWRKTVDPEIVYPRYPIVRSAFLRALDVYRNFLHDRGAGPLIANQCEVTYVNHVEPGSIWSLHGELGAVLAGFYR